jgi:hypothetical protein
LDELRDRGFIVAHEMLDQVSDDEDTAVWLDLSDGPSAGGKVLIVRVGGEWEVAIEVGDRQFWPTFSPWAALAGQITADPPEMDQADEERRRQTIEVLDRLHGDEHARRLVVDAVARWKRQGPQLGA